VRDLPIVTLVTCALDLERMREWAAAERLRRAALARKPRDFWLNHDLAMLLLEQGGARAEEAAGYLRVALALGNDSPAVHINLGNALRDRGDAEGAIRSYRDALRFGGDAPGAVAAAHNNMGNVLA